MVSSLTIYRAPPDSGHISLGQTLPALLDDACDRHPNDHALNYWHQRRWHSLSNRAFRAAAEEVALGLRGLGLQRGDRVAFLMHSDVAFCIADMGCLLAGLVDVPIDLTQTIENILFIVQHTEARALVVSNLDLLTQVMPYLATVPCLRWVVMAEVPDDWTRIRQSLMPHTGCDESIDWAIEPAAEACLQVPQFLTDGSLADTQPLPHLPPGMYLLSLAEIRQRGERHGSAAEVSQLRAAIAPQDLATILYIASETKRPKGVMLTHENIAANILSAFSSYPNLGSGAEETALLFLPLTHVFARAFFYGHLKYGHSIYFSDPNHVVKHLKTVHPTIFITVPRLLEKVHERILDQGHKLNSKFDRAVFAWAVSLAQRYPVGQVPSRLYGLQLKLADRLVFGRWRAVFGDRLKALICGGAALRAELTQFFWAAGVPVLQGYGLTETSAVVCYNRGAYNRAGTVGVPIAGVELAIAPDGEILVKAPFVMQGYYRDPEATCRVLDADDWLHTGDLGHLTADGFLTITGVKKPLFKLSTGKYVSPLPLESTLHQSPLVSRAIAVGANHKFCGMLIFPNLEALAATLQADDRRPFDPTWLHHPCVMAHYQALIDDANCHLPYWSTVRKFALMDSALTVENGLLNPDGTVNRVRLLDTLAAQIDALYRTDPEPPDLNEATTALPPEGSSLVSCPPVSAFSCPIYARSLTHY